MSSNISWELCDTEFLDLNITWYTEHPQFSPCFRNTLLIWLPACILLLATIIEAISIRKARRDGKKTIPWNAFNVMRFFIVILLALAKLLDLISYMQDICTRRLHDNLSRYTFNDETYKLDIGVISTNEGQVVVLSYLLRPFIQLASYSVLSAIYYHQRRAGVHTSGPVWFYLLISVFCSSINYYAVIMSVRYDPINNIERYTDYIHLPLLLVLFIVECRGDTPIVSEDDTQDGDIRLNSPELTASYCSALNFWWYNKFLWYGYKNKLRMSDLWKTQLRDQARKLVPRFRDAWTRRSARPSKRVATYNLANGEVQPVNNMLKVIGRLFWIEILLTAILKLTQDSFQYLTPMILKEILAFMQTPDSPSWHGILFALFMFIVPTVQAYFLSRYFHLIQLVGFHVKTIITGSVYRKALLLSGSSRQESTTGEIVNLMSVDSGRFQDLLLYVHIIWTAPLQILLAIYLLYRELGWSVFAGIICMVVILPANAYLAKRVKYYQTKAMKTKDERIKQMSEVLGGIKVIKLYAWENSFIASIFKFRDRELALLRRILTLDALQEFLWDCCPVIVACVTFAVYVNAAPENVLDAKKAFVSISLFNLLRFPLTMLPNSVTYLIMSLVSARRLNKFLNSNELIKYVTRNESSEAISIEGGTLTWTLNDGDDDDGVEQTPESRTRPRSQDTEPIMNDTDDGESAARDSTQATLTDIDLHVKPKSFVAIVGQVASGKSSLLSAILGEMHRLAGEFNVCKSMTIAYVPQQAWIQNMTVRDNILFGSDYNQDRYEQVLDACSLRPDLEILQGGDQAEIGEKGINLSGGQKQRVSLARACYSNSSIYLLDDPLSALDSHVAKHVYEQVLSSSTGLLRDKTRVLATNSLFILPFVDQVVVLDHGKVVESGTYEELSRNATGYLSEIMRQYSSTQKEKQSTTEASEVDIEEPLIGIEKDKLESVVKASKKKKEVEATGKLIDEEKVATGSVNFRVYLTFLRAASWLWVSLLVTAAIACSASDIASNIWLSIWVTDAEDPSKAKDVHLRTLRLLIYALIGGAQCFFVLSGTLVLCKCAVRASRTLHLNLLERVMHSPMTFFDTTPIGRIVNRFSKDIDVLDSTLPSTCQYWLTCLLQVLSAFLVICYSFPGFLIIMIPLALVYWIVQRIFTVTTRQLKRLESITSSPIYSNFSETLSGASTIRAYNCAERFIESSDTLIDINQTCSYTNIIANRLLSLRLMIFGNIITALAALFSVIHRDTIDAGITGLTISYCLNITQTLNWLTRMTSNMETNIVSVERISEYTQNSQEDEWIKRDNRPPEDWPTNGTIEVCQYSTKYREDLDIVLSNLSFSIKPREKIGIVGRTGSGKSSLSLALFRILEPTSGDITIDGYSISKFGLHDIRSKLTIIPQDPVLFSGTLRFNLDPLKLHSDLDIWRSLELAHLKPYISSLKSGLDYQVSEYGENFSVGQRQLICLARAILRKSKILILDEATASVDLETDSIVQKTIRDIFSDCTIITIAHRLHTILDSDRILVLDSGTLKELDSPAKLIEDESSAFASLVRDAGLDTSSILAQRHQSNNKTTDGDP